MNDLTLALRKLARRPVFSLTTLLCLALGIGATTAIGSVVNTLFFQSASVEDLDRVAFFMAMREGVEPFGVSPLEIEAYRARSQSFRHLGLARTLDGNSVNLTGGERAERVRAAQASTAYFVTLGIGAWKGRLFAPEEERSHGPGALLMSRSLWTRRFGADPSIVGQVLRVNGEVRTVVGILPEGFDLPSKTELWLPVELDFERLKMDELASHSYMMVGRLEDGVSLDRAEAELVPIARDVAAEFPQTNTGWSIALIPLRSLLLGDVQGNMRTLVFALAGAVSLLLLIACVNGAHLFLARCLEQEREIALSSALGASRTDIFRQLFLEGLILAIAAGVLGSVVALAIVPPFMAYSPIHEGAYTNFFRAIEIDGNVLALSFGASVLTAFLFGTLPLIAVLGRDPGHALRNGGRGGGSGRSQARLSRALVVAEVAVSATLLVGAGLLVRSLSQLAALDLGFRPESTLSMEFTLPTTDFPGQTDRNAFSDRILERVRSLSGVVSAGTTTDVPLRLGTWDRRYVIEGEPAPEPGQVPWAAYRAVSPGYLEALGVSLVRGRTFRAEDRADVERVAIVSRELARRALGDGDPVGRRIGDPNENEGESNWRSIVGVVEDVKEDRYNFRIDRPVWYVPYEQANSGVLLNLVVRTREGASEIGSEIRRAVAELYPEVAPGEAFELEPHVAAVVGAERTATLVALLLAVLGTALASFGLYGVMAYGVRQRFRELGLRVAVGASPSQLSRLVLGDGLLWVAFGLAAGFVGALVLARLFSSLLFETRPWDPVTYVVVALLFGVVTLAACYFPARRAGATNPVDALRMD